MKRVIFLLLIPLAACSASTREVQKSPNEGKRHVEGLGTPLRYLVLGDSTAVAEGGTYEQGIVMQTTRHLAAGRRVEVLNVAVTGATIADVLNDQIPRARGFRPDVILLDAGANDVTHLTRSSSIERDFKAIIETLIREDCDAKIVVSGSPDMGAVPRIPFLLRGLAGLRARRLNVIAQRAVKRYDLTFAPIAERTGPIFRKDRTLFAADRFHPNDRGYATWVPVLNEALDLALATQPSHCGKAEGKG